MGNTQTKFGDIPGFALIIHNEDFSFWGSSEYNRTGNAVDFLRVENTLKNLAFKCEEVKDKNADIIKAKIKEVCTDATYSKYRCLVIVVMTHGSYGGTLYAYDSHYNTSDIWTPLATSQNFANKTKLLFFQACRGSEIEGMSGEVVKNTSTSCTPYDPSNDDQIKNMPLLPHDPHFFIAFSTVENVRAIRNLDQGSWFIQTICNIIDNYEISEKIDLNSVITKVTYDIVFQNVGDVVQTPTFTSFLPYNPTFTLKNKSEALTPSSRSTRTAISGDSGSLADRLSNIQFDGTAVNAKDVIQHPSHYKWRRSEAGVCLVFHDDLHEKTAQRMRQLFIDMTYDTAEVIPIISGNTIVTKLQEVAKNFSKVDGNETPDSIAVVILATLSTLNERYEDSHVAGDTCISDTWSLFKASKCKALLGRPKLFFYLHSRNVKDNPPAGRSSVASNLRFNDHQDFYWIFGYGQEFIECLENNLRSGFDQQHDFHSIITQATSEARVISQNKVVAPHSFRKLPYRKYTLTLTLIIGDKNNYHNQSNTQQQVASGEGTSTADEGFRLAECLNNIPRKDYLLHLAAIKGDLKALKTCLKEGIDVNTKNKNGQTTLYVAIKHNQLEIVTYLIKKCKADVNVRLNDDETLLQGACLFGNVRIVKFLLENGAEVDGENANGDTALIIASANGKINIVALLVEYGADVHYFNNDGTTALHRACELGSYNCVEYLIQQGADVNFKGGKTSLTPLHLAVRDTSEMGIKEVDFLLYSGADINLKSYDGTSVFQSAIEYHTDVKILFYLVKCGADMKHMRFDRSTALHIAAKLGKIKFVKWLIQNKCGTELIIDRSGKTPLHLAVEYGHLDCVKFLVENTKANSYRKYLISGSLLHLAVKSGNLEICKYLVKGGANINVFNSKEWSPLHIAAEKGYTDIVLWLLQLGASIEIQDDNEETALQVAQASGQNKIVAILMKHKNNAC